MARNACQRGALPTESMHTVKFVDFAQDSCRDQFVTERAKMEAVEIDLITRVQ